MTLDPQLYGHLPSAWRRETTDRPRRMQPGAGNRSEELATSNAPTNGAATSNGRATAGEDRFVIRLGRRMVLVPVRDVIFVEAEGNYARLHLDGESHLLRATMKALEKRLSERGFVRIHRSTIVRCSEVAEIRATSSGDHEVTLKSGVVKRWSRTYRDQLEEFLGD